MIFCLNSTSFCFSICSFSFKFWRMNLSYDCLSFISYCFYYLFSYNWLSNVFLTIYFLTSISLLSFFLSSSYFSFWYFTISAHSSSVNSLGCESSSLSLSLLYIPNFTLKSAKLLDTSSLFLFLSVCKSFLTICE